ncbi:recombinase family protein [Paraburkholderia sp. A1RI-2L]|uniref:recombinase family protein n=1 Tax=Paraburkholderia sp. A1RI-2L TaxID=3028367 RepID=UPI003B82B55C
MKKPLKTASNSSSAPSRLFIYGRFSSAKQARGDSFARQMDYARRWAVEHDHVIDESLTMFDHGLSAYKGDHVKKGALGAFLVAIREKKLVRPGDVLLVESLDRLSRAEPIDAQRQFAEIIDSGVAIVTADTGQIYSRERLKHDSSPLFVALAIMIRAHEESASKGRRIRDALRRQCEGWVGGTWRGKLNINTDPTWLRYNAERRVFEFDPQQAESLRTLIDLYREGYGPLRAIALMHERGVPIPAGISDAYRLHVVMKNRALVGEKVVTVEGNEEAGIDTQTFVLRGYYPPLMSEAEFASLQYVMSQRGRRAGKSDIVGIMTGLGITFCAHCGFAMAGQNTLSRARKEPGRVGQVSDGSRRILCSGLLKMQSRCQVKTCSIAMIERGLMNYCADQMNLAALFADSNEKCLHLRESLAFAHQAVIDTQTQIDKFMAAAASDDDETPESMMQFIRKLDSRLRAEKLKVTGYEHEIEALSHQSQPAAAQAWAELREGVDSLDIEARTKARQLVANTFKRIEVSLLDPAWVGMKLVSKRDVTRILWINRKTGELMDQVTVEDTTPHEAKKTLNRLKRAA